MEWGLGVGYGRERRGEEKEGTAILQWDMKLGGSVGNVDEITHYALCCFSR